MALEKSVQDFLGSYLENYSFEETLAYLERAEKFKILVVGEAIIDEYQYCEAIGKSSKEPTLVVKRNSMEKFAGGTLAVANHVANFCNEVSLLTFLGAQQSEENFIAEKLNKSIERLFLFRKNSPTIVKRRFIEEYFFSKLLEVYEINDAALDEEDNRELCSILKEKLPHYDMVIVVDFGHNMLSSEAINILCREAKFLAVNVQANAGNLGYNTISNYERADYISITENELRLESRDRRGDLKHMVLEISQKLNCDHISITRGKYGCLCYSKSQGFFEIPSFASQVVDRVGAGDAFLSLTALCVLQEAPMEVVGFVGNSVGAQAVATVGHRRFIEREPLFEQIRTLLS